MRQRNVRLTKRKKAQNLTLVARVSNIRTPHRNDLHQYKSSQIPVNSCLYDLQEFDDYLDRIRRGSLVWWLRHANGSFLFRPYGPEFRHRGLGRHQACSRISRTIKRRSDGKNRNVKCWIHLDVDQLPVHSGICAWNAEKDQADQFQRFRQ
jgi:hypothetical protein